ncbi:MAG: ATP-grasp domain-containing protein [Chlorobiaceae bacterium]|nr:ATP-grasp domain-containing protein [Chlorobiaceae bacterium]
MIIGGGAEQVPAYKLAKQRGLFVVGTDLNPDAPALRFADHAILASTRDAEQTARCAVEFHSSHTIAGVMTIANDVPYTVARVADALGLPGIGLEAARNVVDKLLMKQCFGRHGVSCPWFTGIGTADELRTLLRAESGTRFVLKPVDGRGARGVLLIDSSIDVDWAFEESKRWGDSGRLILEKFVPGMQLSTESFILDGKCYTPAIAERNYDRLEQFAPNIIEDGGTIPAPLDEALRSSIDDTILRGAAALGIHEGIVKGDLVIAEDGQPMIIELAARLSGGWFATHQIPFASGVDLVSAVMSHALGEPLDECALQPSWSAATAIRYWYPPEGRIVSIRGEEELKKVPGLISYGFFRKTGDMQPKVLMHPDRFGFAIVGADTRQEALFRMEMALNSVQVEVAP